MSQVVLVVDDDPVQRRLLETTIQRFGYQTIVAEGGDAAVKLLSHQDTRIDAMVLDLVMPDLDGLGVLAFMREAGLRPRFQEQGLMQGRGLYIAVKA